LAQLRTDPVMTSEASCRKTHALSHQQAVCDSNEVCLVVQGRTGKFQK